MPFNDKLRLILIKLRDLKSPEANTLFRALSTSDAATPSGMVGRVASVRANKYLEKRVKTLDLLRRLIEDDPDGDQGHLFGYIKISVPKPPVLPQPVARSVAPAHTLFLEGGGDGNGGGDGEEEGGIEEAAGAVSVPAAAVGPTAAAQVVNGIAPLQAEKRKAEAPLERVTSRLRSGAR